MLEPELRHQALRALGVLDVRALRLRAEAEFAGVTRHKAKPPHVQSSHGRKGPRGLAKTAAKKAAATVAASVSGQAALDAVPLGSASPDLTSGQRASLRAYVSPQHFLTINGSLRGNILHGAPPAGPTSNRHIANLDRVMAQSRTTDRIEVWRGLQGGADQVFGAGRMSGDMTGLEWQEKGFMSTSVRKSAAREFTQSAGSVLMRVVAPKGTGAAKLAERENDGEGEVVLQRGLKLRVVADRGIDKDWGHRTLDVEVIAE